MYVLPCNDGQATSFLFKEALEELRCWKHEQVTLESRQDDLEISWPILELELPRVEFSHLRVVFSWPRAPAPILDRLVRVNWFSKVARAYEADVIIEEVLRYRKALKRKWMKSVTKCKPNNGLIASSDRD